MLLKLWVTTVLYVVHGFGTQALVTPVTTAVNSRSVRLAAAPDDDNANSNISNAGGGNSEFLSQQTFGGYTVKQRLREEVESPFRKVRLILFGSSVGSAFIALYFSFLGTIKAVANTSSMQETGTLRFPDAQPLDEVLTSDAINIGAVVICGVLCYREYQAGQVNLRRIAQGGRLASLAVEARGNRRKSLKDFRRAARVVLAVGGEEYMQRLATSLASTDEMATKLAQSDLVVVPVPLVGSGTDLRVANDAEELWRKCLGSAGVSDTTTVANDDDDPDARSLADVLAIPRGPSAWTEYMNEFDLDTAMTTQNIDVMSKGIFIVVKKNGKILRRATGLPPFEEMIGFMEVADGSKFGMPGDSEKYGGP